MWSPFSREKVRQCPGTDKCGGCARLFEKLNATPDGRDSLCARFTHPVGDLDKPSGVIRLCLRKNKNPIPASICDGAVTGTVGTMAFITDPDERGNHYATRLAQEMEKKLQQAGAEELRLEIAPLNRTSQAIATRLGAKIVDDNGGVNYADPYDASDIWKKKYKRQ